MDDVSYFYLFLYSIIIFYNFLQTKTNCNTRHYKESSPFHSNKEFTDNIFKRNICKIYHKPYKTSHKIDTILRYIPLNKQTMARKLIIKYDTKAMIGWVGQLLPEVVDRVGSILLDIHR